MSHSCRVLVLAVLACFAAKAGAVDFGRTQGTFSVSPSGAATYNIPIWTPPGPNGLTPSISLSYSSQGGNGLVGVGWNLNAVTAIERCVRTKNQDGNGAPVDLSMNDRYCIAGNRLRLASGTYGAASSVYYTELADYSRITASTTTIGNGPDHFVVEAKSGLKYEYGNVPGARVVLNGTVLRWMLNKVSDRSGNTYVVSYNNSNGFTVPDVISWTPTFQGSTAYRYDAKFNYSTGRTDPDSYIGRVAGQDVSNRYRLENIQIKSNGAVVRKYHLYYDTSSTTSRSRLTSAQECADDAEGNCFIALTFAYQAGQVGVTTAASAGATGSSLYTGKYDFNGDGRSDLLFVTGSTWKVAFSTGSGVGTPVDTGVSSAALFTVDHFLADHQDGLLVAVSGTWYYVAYTGTQFISTSTGIPVPTGYVSGGQPRATDNNGDGLADILWTVGGSVMLRLNTSAPGATVPTFGNAFTAASFTVGQGNVGIINSSYCPLTRICDLNGDGRGDLNVNVHSVTGCGIGGCSQSDTRYDLMATGSGYSIGAFTGALGYRGIRFNDDSCIDRLDNNSSTTLLISGCNSGAPTSVAVPTNAGVPLDWNGDGKTDLVVNNGGYFGVYLSTGSAAAPFSTLISTAIAYPTGCNPFVFDLDGDGFDDIACVGTSSPFNVSYYTHAGGGGSLLTQQPDLLTSITDGFGVNISPSYASTSQGNYTRGTATAVPLSDVTDPVVVVAQVTRSDGIGSTFNTTYAYVGARENVERGEFAGFQRIEETDSRNGLITRTYFDQLFPIAGMVSQRELMQPNGTTPISRVVSTNTSTPLNPSDPNPNNGRFFAYASGSTTTEYEVGGTWNGSLLRTVTTSNTYETTSGTLYDLISTTTEPLSGAHGTNDGGSWTAHTSLPLANLINDTTNWCLGRPQLIQQTNSSNRTYYTPITRSTNLTWDQVKCRPTQTVDESGSATLQVTTDIGYDGFGNVNSTTVTGANAPVRKTTTNYLDSPVTTGQFPVSVTRWPTSTVSETSTMTWSYDLGVPLSATDPNILTVSWQYDGFGRRKTETRPDGTSSDFVYKNCADVSYCPGFIKTTETASDYDNTGAAVARVTRYRDSFGRVVQQFRRSRDWISTNTNTEYDSSGRIARTSAPCFAAGSGCATQYWTSNTYDLVSRITTVSEPISDADPSLLQSTTIDYEGLTTRVKDPQDKYSYSTLNAAGQVARSQDHDGNYQDFDYDAFGNIKRVTDSSGNTLQSSSYNLRGMLTDRSDMDMGAWVYDPDALGEVAHVRDAKTSAPAWTQTLTYDGFGRLTGRSEPEGTSTWTWGASSSLKNIGSLVSVSGPGYSESYAYDGLARPSTVTVSADNSYQFDYTYNSMGALDTLTYPTSTASYRLKLQYDYLNGQLHSIKDFNAPTTVFWTANAGNPRDQIVQETLGGSLFVTNRVFDVANGRLKSVQSGAGGGTGIQNLEYHWDKVGNLSSRIDKNQSNLTEAFTYDNLYRLDHSTLNGTTNLQMAYDALGNITSKSDVGSYTYDATKKHQVVSTSNGWSFVYDANGNMTSGRGATITPTSYNYPASITNGADSSSFSYTPDRQYWKQVSNYTSGGSATTTYVGGLLEKVFTTAGGTDYRHMIRAGSSTIIVSRQDTGTNSVYYVTSDQLGSSSAITNASGVIVVNESFGAFGARRGSNWTGSPSSGDWSAIASTTRRGFTEHTMLDNLGLIHMNGRVQDPVIGRFISADPYIADPSNTQSYNRYSYVLNDPLSMSDPTGFWQNEAHWPSDVLWPGERVYQNTCDPDDIKCWRPWTGQFEDGILPRFYTDSRNAKYGDIGSPEIGSLPVPTIAEISISFSAWDASTGCAAGNEGMCHHYVPQVKRNGLIFDLFVDPMLGWLDCGMASGSKYECTNSQWAWKGVAFAATITPFKMAGPLEKAVAGEANVAARGSEYLYRGVHAGHPAFEDALLGRAMPGDINGIVSAAEHNAGGVAAESPFTSWTSDLEVALSNANKKGEGGLLLRVRTGAPPPGAGWSWEWSPDIFGESERLLRGVREGCDVILCVR